MSVVLERELSFADLRKTQRRVSALLLTDSRVDIQKYSLRRKVLPKGFCYVCSRIDPTGIFRNQNSYLFRQGFFNGCEHTIPKAPYTTFVAEDTGQITNTQKLDGKSTSETDNRKSTSETDKRKTNAPSITVTIRKSSRSDGVFDSPLRRERTFSTIPKKYGSDLPPSSVSASPILRKSRNTHKMETESQLKLPPLKKTKTKSDISSENKTRTVTQQSESKSYVNSDKHRPSRTDRSERYTGYKTEIPSYLTASRNEDTSCATSDTPISQMTNTEGRVTVIPTGEMDNRSIVTGLSTLSKGTTPSKSSNDLESKTMKSTTATVTVDKGVLTDRTEITESDRFPSRPFVNQSDGLNSIYTTTPLVREVVMLDGNYGKPQHRPKAGHLKERFDRNTDRRTSVDTHTEERPESGHFLYHHRLDEDSVPDPGFEIPPTPTDAERLEMEAAGREQESERLELERQIAEGDVFDTTSSKAFGLESISDDASLRLSERNARSKRSAHLSGHNSFCRCSTAVREMSFAKTTCKTCGKSLRQGSFHSSSDHGITRTDCSFPGRNSLRTSSTRSKHNNVIYDGRRDKSGAQTDEDYMDLDSIIHEDDGHYFSSDDDGVESETSSYMRRKGAKPYPLVNPDIHKLVYIRALNEAKMRGMKKNANGFDDLQQLRHPHVFSYFQLLPNTSSTTKTTSELIGIKHVEPEPIKKGQYMKHIFGDVKLDDFYVNSSSSKVEQQSEESAMERDAKQNAIENKKRRNKATKNKDPLPLSEPERSSVSLKLKKQGVIVD